MARKIEYTSLTQSHSILNGFLAGCLIAGGIFAPYGLFIQAVLFLVGLFVLIDTIMPHGEMLYAVTVVVFTVIGFVVTLILSILVFIFLLTAASYFYRFKSLKSHH